MGRIEVKMLGNGSFEAMGSFMRAGGMILGEECKTGRDKMGDDEGQLTGRYILMLDTSENMKRMGG